MQNKYFQESIKSTLTEPLFKKATFYEADIVAKVDPRTYKVTQSNIKTIIQIKANLFIINKFLY
ncbi:hypothetical protein D1W98_02205 [Campylobacter jejuni]|uniref:Uncharacterized protein n=1 Tax=Campylobacter jejuni TaxID=197 RepID=A0A5T1IZ44_CAMJU|nr:hypothetical protein [Campylobacter jejuni]NGY41616.1 hypothetical protein [Campylobacter sp. CFSAN093229]EAH4596270.1 hypothetical protein [Campylobacter jejuni]EAH5417604.1 hypothetical protein [Campylobacter jejuni]EAH7216234.1 hypothetical protein [Campylobacter jejuni]